MNFTTWYNVRVKTFPDGKRQYMWSEKVRAKGYEIAEDLVHTGESVERKERENLSRAKSKVYDLARSNKFDWFITLELSPECVSDRLDYEQCAEVVYCFTHRLAMWGNKWIIVPEKHPTTGAWHFHGLVQGDLKLTRAYSAKTGKPLFDKHGREIFNLDDYEFGFTTAIPLDGSPKVASYITKYYTKEMVIPKGKKRYWASRSLVKPLEELVCMSTQEFGEIFNNARYQKSIESPYGSFLLCED